MLGQADGCARRPTRCPVWTVPRVSTAAGLGRRRRVRSWVACTCSTKSGTRRSGGGAAEEIAARMGTWNKDARADHSGDGRLPGGDRPADDSSTRSRLFPHPADARAAPRRQTLEHAMRERVTDPSDEMLAERAPRQSRWTTLSQAIRNEAMRAYFRRLPKRHRRGRVRRQPEAVGGRARAALLPAGAARGAGDGAGRRRRRHVADALATARGRRIPRLRWTTLGSARCAGRWRAAGTGRECSRVAVVRASPRWHGEWVAAAAYPPPVGRDAACPVRGMRQGRHRHAWAERRCHRDRGGRAADGARCGR